MAPLPRRAKIWPTATDRCSPPPIFGSPIVCDFENGTSSVLIFISHLSDHCQHDRQFSINQYQTFIRQTTSSINGAFTIVRVCECECECECECHLGGFASFKKMPFGEKIAEIFILSDYFVFGLSTTHPRGESPSELKRVGKSGHFGEYLCGRWNCNLTFN